jgi:predicted phage-related endonuclease
MALMDRRAYLGGSDAAAIFGVSPWATPLNVYMQKRGEAPAPVADLEREKRFRRGKRMEPIVIQMLVEDEGIAITRHSTAEAPNRYFDNEHNFLAAEIDFEWSVTAEMASMLGIPARYVGTVQNGDVKTVGTDLIARRKFGEAGTDEIPIEYAAQFMHGMMVTNRDLTLVSVLIGADQLVHYVIYRDDETIAAMREKSVRFWFDHVIAGVPPEPVNLPDVHLLFRKRPASAKEADEQALRWIRELREAQTLASQAGIRIEELKYELGRFLLGDGYLTAAKPGKHIVTAAGVELLSMSLQSQTRLDGDALKAKHPEIAKACMKTTSFYVTRTKKESA